MSQKSNKCKSSAIIKIKNGQLDSCDDLFEFIFQDGLERLTFVGELAVRRF
jgi:hypothetical protein